MINRFLIIILPVILGLSLSACGVKTAVPGFEYPVYTPDAKWPTLSPTAELEKAAEIDVEAAVEDVERLKRLSGIAPASN